MSIFAASNQIKPSAFTDLARWRAKESSLASFLPAVIFVVKLMLGLSHPRRTATRD